MNRIASFFGVLTLLVSPVFAAEVVPPAQIPIPVISRLVVPGARLPMRLEKVDVKAEVLGNVAHTRIEMVFYNPNTRVLEGELQFPLSDGETVTGFALDINGELRPAVPVDKAKGQQVFEELSRARIDPALLEKTQGDNYKLRIYPLPANGSRRVVLELDQVLTATRNGSSYRLPLQFAEKINQLNVSVNNAAIPTELSQLAVSARLGAERIAVKYNNLDVGHSGSLVSFSRKNYLGHAALNVDYQTSDRTTSVVETRADQTYFYAEVTVPRGKPAIRIAPKKLGIVWDASGSGVARDHGREFALLDAYFKLLGNVSVELVIARDVAEKAQSFVIEQGDWHAVRTVLENVVYDGATSSSALSSIKSTDFNLLFSDGLSNYGMGILLAGDVPLYAVNGAASADLPRLRAVVDPTGGRVLNLLSLTPAEAVNELTHQHGRLISVRSNDAKELVSTYEGGRRLQIAGILTEPEATLTLDWIDAQGVAKSRQIVVRDKAVSTQAASRWAAMKLAQLEGDYTNNRAAIRRLGNQFGMVTRETSLIVLDRVEDYVRYEIVPPASLRAEYEAQLAKHGQQISQERSAHLNDIAERFAAKIDWWEKTFPKGDKPEPPKAKYAEALAYATAPVAMAPRMLSTSNSEPVAPSNFFSSEPVVASIKLKKWQSDAPYAKRLRETAPEQMYHVYLDERPSYVNSTAFFLDAADIFIERGQMELGLRILSNLAEMNLENRAILRILAYRLLQAKQTKLALPVLQQVLALSPNEPQSWRDLGLAYADDGQYQLAVNNLWEVVSQPWHGRFPDVELIALAELNAIIARAPKEAVIDTSRMDARLLRNLPLDLRAVLSWDSDNADIDLWVIDPNNEKVYYGNRLGYQGGAMSRDFTGGYGPEEFSLRNAKPGKYKVQAQFFGNRQQVVAGATTLMLRLSTGFGTAQQKEENIILRLTGQGSLVDVGTFDIKP
jgi:tetratricopeptide (TPR) repeat protein